MSASEPEKQPRGYGQIDLINQKGNGEIRITKQSKVQ